MNRLVEIALFTTKVDQAAEFYRDLLGVEPDYRGEGIAIFNISGMKLLIHKKDVSAVGMPPNEDHFAFGVLDLNASSNELTRRGLKLAIEPRKFDWGRSAYLRDPDGRLVELYETQE